MTWPAAVKRREEVRAAGLLDRSQRLQREAVLLPSCVPVKPLKSVAGDRRGENCEAFTKPMFVRNWSVLRTPVMKTLSRPAPTADSETKLYQGMPENSWPFVGAVRRIQAEADREDAALDADVAVVGVQAGIRIRRAVRAGQAGVEDQLAEAARNMQSVADEIEQFAPLATVPRRQNLRERRLRPVAPVEKITETSTDWSAEVRDEHVGDEGGGRARDMAGCRNVNLVRSAEVAGHRRTGEQHDLPRPRPTVSL